MKIKYKLTAPRFSKYHNDMVVDILKKGKLFWVIPFWFYHDTILNKGQAEEVVYLLNNPAEMERRILAAIEKIPVEHRNIFYR
jgi:hypothetical protein